MKTITLKQITDTVLPGLRAIHGDDDAQITKSLKEQLSTMTVVGEDGKPLGEVEFVVTGTTVKAETKSTPTDDARIGELVGKAVGDAMAKNSTDIKRQLGEIITGGTFRNDDTKTSGWKSFGEFALGVRKASGKGAGPSGWDERLLTKAPTTYGSEGVGADGGFAVPPDYRDQIMRLVLGEQSLLALTDQITTSRNSVVFPTDETTPWQTSGGIQGAWLEEAALKSQSKPSLKQVTVSLKKFAVLVPITDELLEDSSAMSSYVPSKAGEKIDFAVSLAIVQGTGAGQPLGIINSPAAISVAKVGSQVADTIVALNVLNMWSRLYAPYRRESVWLVNQDAEPQLALLMKQGKLDTGAADTGWGIGPLYYQGLESGQPTLLGRPVIFTQATETVGDKGDIILWAPKQYLSLVKGGGVKSDVSMHLWFDYDVTAFRFVIRVGGRPWLSAPIAARDGSATYSSIVTLDDRT